MPLARHPTRRRVVLAAVLLAVAGMAAVVLFSWAGKSAERSTYDRIELDMTSGQVEAILRGWRRVSRWTEFAGRYVDLQTWQSPNGATIKLSFGPGDRVRYKEFEEGDLSLWGTLKRLAGRPYWP